MTKKDYELIARALKDSKPEYDNKLNGILNQWHKTVLTLADSLVSTNPHFNRAKFLRACGYND